MYFSELQEITDGLIVQFSSERAITELLIDSRKASTNEQILFFAIEGERHDGHAFIPQLHALGIRQFVVEKEISIDDLPGANIIRVQNSVKALQAIARSHREQFSIPVIGITGSNGKTIVKEWLYQLLSPDFAIVKNPGSYNSQLGTPLSVWHMQAHHTLGIFEAGISRKGEMLQLEYIIQPTIGIFTMIGTAHDEGFTSVEEKINEKLKLFRHVGILIYNCDQREVRQAVVKHQIPALSWGTTGEADIQINRKGNDIEVTTRAQTFSLTLPFDDNASVENCMHCITLMTYLKCNPNDIRTRVSQLRRISMRLELKEGINHCQIIDDSYNNDLAGLQISLEFLSNQYQKKRKTVILSDILQAGLPEEELVAKIASVVQRWKIDKFIGIGPALLRHQTQFAMPAHIYQTMDDFFHSAESKRFHDEVILIKGARSFQFERIVNRLQLKVHGTIMEIDLGALINNLNYFKSRLKSQTKIMVMVKAFAYGAGSVEIANVLQYHKVDYLGVAYADEGVELRKNNIITPIMVMNPTEESFAQLLEYKLEPEIYNLRMLESLASYLNGEKCTIHIKLDTGMHRLGFEDKDLKALVTILGANRNLIVGSIFSHLAGSDDKALDDFSHDQASKFRTWADRVSASLAYRPLYHLLNSSGILRLPEYHFDMVRLGIGLHGIDPSGENGGLKKVATLKTFISQIKKINKGDTVSYGRAGKANTDLIIATLAIGYADGFNRAFSNGVGEVLVNGKLARVIGNVCMDMTMVDVTGLEAHEGDEVIVFGPQLPIEKLAEKIGTIPYEILTNTSERVKRVFAAESI